MGEGIDEVVDGIHDIWLSNNHTDVRMIVIGYVVCHNLNELLHSGTNLRRCLGGPLIKHFVCDGLRLRFDILGTLIRTRGLLRCPTGFLRGRLREALRLRLGL